MVTGAGSGIGRHAAIILARHGATVTLAARRADKLAETEKAISAAGGTVRSVPMDVTNEASVRAGFDAAQTAAGPVEILFNNAGVAGYKSLLEMDSATWDRIIDTNLKGAWLCAREAAKRLIAANRPGAIINVGSVLGFEVQKGTGPYAASKAGLHHLTRAMASEWVRYRIRVNALAPGYFTTDMTDDFLASEHGKKFLTQIPMRRAGTVEELSGAILLLASDASAYMTGSIVTVDGGASLGVL